MAPRESRISQYLRKEKLDVTVAQVINPTHFILKESPSLTMSDEARNFLELEEQMQVYYSSVDSILPFSMDKETVIAVQFNKKWYRAKICRIIHSSKGLLSIVYLLDYGEEHQIEKERMREIENRFLTVPYQAIHFKLSGLQPVTLQMDPLELKFRSELASEWDEAAERYIQRLVLQDSSGAQIEVKGIGEDNCVFGFLYLTINHEIVCVNTELIKEKYAVINPDNLNEVIDMDKILASKRNDIASLSDEIRSEKLKAKLDVLDRKKKLFKEYNSRKPPAKQHQIVSPSAQTPCSPTSHVSETKCRASRGRSSLGVLQEESQDDKDSVKSKKSKCDVQEGNMSSASDSDSKLNFSPSNTNKEPVICDQLSPSDQQNKIDLGKRLLYIKSLNSAEKKKKSPLKSPSAISNTSQQVDSGEEAAVQNQIEESSSTTVALQNSCKSAPRASPEHLSSNYNFSSEKGTNRVCSPPAFSIAEEVASATTAAEEDSKITENKQCKMTLEKLNEIKSLLHRSKAKTVASSVQSQVGNNSSTKSTSRVCHSKDNQSATSDDSFKFSDVESDNPVDCVLNVSGRKFERKTSDEEISENVYTLPLNSSELDPYFKTEMCFDDKSLWEQLKVPAVRFGDDVPSPILCTEKAPFAPKLRKILDEKKFCGPSSIQSVVWPAMFRNRSLVAVAPPHSGKTIAYLLPLLSNFIQSGYECLPPGNGPVLIILCSSWRKVLTVYQHCHLFLGDAKVKLCKLYNDGVGKRKKELSLINGCDILIATPACLVEMVQCSATNFERCCHFILDDGNCLMEELDQLIVAMKMFVSGIERRNSLSFSLQVILCIERWTRGVGSFINTFMLNPLVFFTSFLECAIYAKIPILPHVCSESEKNKVLLEILEKARKAVICTSNIETAFEVHTFLRHEGMRTFLLNEELEHYNADSVLKSWKAMQSTFSASCLVITDAALIRMSVSDANCLIHYDVPEVSRLQFGYRFSCIAGHFDKKEDLSTADCICHIIMSEDCPVQARSLVKILHRTSSHIPQELKHLAKHQVTKDAHVPLCHYFKAFGSCSEMQCVYRHNIDISVDKPSAIVVEGDIHALVTHVFDASHYYMRILKCISPEMGQMVSYSSKYAELGFALKEFYSKSENQIRVESPVIGKTYIIDERNNLYFRVRVMDKIPAKLGEKAKLKLAFLDEGRVKHHASAVLYDVSDRLQLSLPLAVEVYLCNVDTPDSCPDWCPPATTYVSNLIQERIVCGKIVLCLGETLWLHPVALREKLHYLTEHLDERLDEILKSSGYAKTNRQHLLILKKLCDDKIPQPRILQPTRKLPDQVNLPSEVNYAFLDCDVSEDVYVSSVVTPHQLYVQRAKFVDCLDNLIDAINEKKRKSVFKKLQPPQKGMHCIAPFYEDNKFYRATITKISTTSTENVELFYVDFGDTGSVSEDEIFAIPPEFMLLPFQAIECELSGTCPPHGGFSDRASNTIHDLTRDTAGNMKILSLKALTKTARYDGGNHYIVDILTNGRSLSELLLQEGLVNLAEKPELPLSKTTADDFSIIPEVPSGYILSSDDEMLPEEKDAAALFCGVLAGYISKNHRLITGATDEKDDALPKMDESVNKRPKAKLKEVISISEHRDISADSHSASKLPPLISISSVTKSLKPHILWWNSIETVHVSIQLKNVQVYDIEFFNDRFKFSTTHKDSFYSTEEILFSEVKEKETIVELTAQALNITFLKKCPIKWSRLTKEDRKFFHIKYDLDHIESDSDEEICPQVPENEIVNGDNSATYFSDDESSSSTDEDEKYVQPWTKAAEYRDPYNLFA